MRRFAAVFVLVGALMAPASMASAGPDEPDDQICVETTLSLVCVDKPPNW